MKQTWYSLMRMITPVLFGSLLFLGILYKSFFLIGIFMVSSLLFGAFHCGWLCPFGYLQELLGKLGRKLHIPHFSLPRGCEKYLRFLRYLLFILSFTGLGFIYFLGTPYSQSMGFLTGLGGAVIPAAALLTGAFLALSLFMDRPFCRYFCTEGARYGALSMARFFTVKRKKETCISCRKCDKACPAGINISRITQVRNGQCINCFECIRSCPRDKTLTYGWALKKRPPVKENENEKTE